MADTADMIDKTDTNDCKHCSDRMNCKKIKTLETGHTDRKMNNYQKHYLVVNTADLNAETVMAYQVLYGDYTY